MKDRFIFAAIGERLSERPFEPAPPTGRMFGDDCVTPLINSCVNLIFWSISITSLVVYGTGIAGVLTNLKWSRIILSLQGVCFIYNMLGLKKAIKNKEYGHFLLIVLSIMHIALAALTIPRILSVRLVSKISLSVVLGEALWGVLLCFYNQRKKDLESERQYAQFLQQEERKREVARQGEAERKEQWERERPAREAAAKERDERIQREAIQYHEQQLQKLRGAAPLPREDEPPPPYPDPYKQSSS